MPRRKDLAEPSHRQRCFWCTDDPTYTQYHDDEWGRPVHLDQRHFEMLVLEGAQAGLSWLTILKRRAGYRRAFKDFEPTQVARFTNRHVETLLNDPGIIRNRLKVESAISNARAFLKVQDEFDGFDQYVWRFVDGSPLRTPGPLSQRTYRATSPESDHLSKDLKERGFSFVGSTIVYAYMQATGLVNDHEDRCFCAPNYAGLSEQK